MPEFQTSQSLPDERFLDQVGAGPARVEHVQSGRSLAYTHWNVHRRVIPEHLAYMILEHACEGRVAGKPVRLEPGSLLWIMPGTLHELHIPPERPPFLMLHFKIGLYAARVRPLRPKRPYVFLPQAQDLQPLLGGLVEELNRSGRYHALRTRAWLALFFSEALLRAQAAQAQGLSDRQRQLLGAFVREHIGRRPSPADLAELLRLSPDYFARLFRQTYGLPPRQWLVRERMNAAAQRLAESTQTISEIAYALGFRDVFLFSRQFKQVFGRSPRAYRK